LPQGVDPSSCMSHERPPSQLRGRKGPFPGLSCGRVIPRSL
jgi:hypothetical protein